MVCLSSISTLEFHGRALVHNGLFTFHEWVKEKLVLCVNCILLYGGFCSLVQLLQESLARSRTIVWFRLGCICR